ncbi:opioid growth factor receptor-like protein 1 [Myxocyprinus asiaticus]|uniref:opioid growth factor receptor-like protein 1 n=1 Tax=Myxocyprinus asiaticus TaxID=70543 RepID=UPI002223D740|nr:opioid growth factor receptor-like protein 1 [Myxocyprinus asiaticus]
MVGKYVIQGGLLYFKDSKMTCGLHPMKQLKLYAPTAIRDDKAKPKKTSSPDGPNQTTETLGIYRSVGPLPRTQNGNEYILIFVDYFSKWVKGHLMVKSDALANFTAKLVPVYSGPYRVTKKLSDVIYRLSKVDNGEDAGVFHVVNLQPFHSWDTALSKKIFHEDDDEPLSLNGDNIDEDGDGDDETDEVIHHLFLLLLYIIHEFHKKWNSDYDRLERVHSYIQWLFPLQEPGMNWGAHVLTKKEIKHFREDVNAKKLLVKSYMLMLDFYGIQLVSECTGEVRHADNWEDRFRNLNKNTHNNLRITRILKCLGTLGFQHYQAPLVKFFLKETLVEGNLERVKQSVLDYIVFAVLDKPKRRELIRFAFKHFEPKDEFVWGPMKILLGDVNKHGESETFRDTTKDECMLSEKSFNRKSKLDGESNGKQVFSKHSACSLSTSNTAKHELETPESENKESNKSKQEVIQVDNPSGEMESVTSEQNGKPNRNETSVEVCL